MTPIHVLRGCANFVERCALAFDFSVEQSIASLDNGDAVRKAEHARLRINHDARQTIAHAPATIE